MFVCVCILVFSAHVEFLFTLTGSVDPEEHKHPLAPPTLPSHLGNGEGEQREWGNVCVCVFVWVCGGVGLRNVGEEGIRRVGENHPYCQAFNENSLQNIDVINMSTSITGL